MQGKSAEICVANAPATKACCLNLSAMFKNTFLFIKTKVFAVN